MQILRYISLIAIVLLSFAAVAQGDVYMHPNQGQWHQNILQKIDLALGEFLVEKDGFTYNLHNGSQKLREKHDHDNESHHVEEVNEGFDRHVIKTKFLNSSWSGLFSQDGKSNAYRNYYLGNDSTKWASEVFSYNQLVMNDYYPGVDLELTTKNENLKYSFIVQPNTDISNISFSIEGTENVFIDKQGNLHIPTRFGDIIESTPKAWTTSENRNTPVNCIFKVRNNVVSFQFPDGYNSQEVLVIDPDLTFSTFTGSNADNWGFTAAPDQNGNLYGGGIVFGAGYPITTGAFDGTFNGGQGSAIDIGISKFNSNGTVLMYSTYIGGNGSETPHSIVVDDLNQLYIMGATSSTNFPVSANAIQSGFMAGTATTQNGLQFDGSDIFVTKLNAGGTNLLASTYLGGTGNDGLNTSVLNYNYGDQFRGEIIVDASNNVYVASVTNSTNFPIVNGQDNSLGGNQDAVALKLNSNLSAILWSTYYGGTGFETGNSLQISSGGNVYLTGGTTSTVLNLISGENLTYAGGQSDGYVVQLNGTNSNVISGTYINSSSYDQAYFVQLDLDDNVYIFGQTDGTMPITAGKYGTANSGQFIRKYSEDLGTLEWSTRIGSGSGNIEISPTAFLVSDCYDIYIAGWGGLVNSNNSQATNSSSNGFQTTPDAYQSATNGNNFYIAVIGDDGASLDYATYIGGTTGSSNHVDGGTSRFDKTGRIYHAVCGSCGAPNNGFTTTPGVWSPTAQSSNCNLAAFKFDLSLIESIVNTPTPFVCIPDPVDFINNSSNGNGFFWDFGDNTTSTDVNPSHFYNSPGDYDVMLIVSDTNGCYESDTSVFVVSIGIFEGAIVQPPTPVCPDVPYQLEASGGSVYAWTPANLLDNPSSATPMATVSQGTLFTVIVSDSCGSDTLTAFLDVYGATAEIINDTSICVGDSIEVWVTGGSTYSWSPSNGLAYTDQATTMASPSNTTTYTVDIVTAEGCDLTRSFTIEVFFNEPLPVIPDTAVTCENQPVVVSVSGATEYTWFPDYAISSTTGTTNTISTNVDTTYYVDFRNACGVVRDSVRIDVITVEAFAGNDTIVCPGELANVYATGGVSYSWSPAYSVVYPNESNTFVQPNNPTTYFVTVTDENGCSDVASVLIDHFPLPYVQASPDYFGFEGDAVQLEALGSSMIGTYTWSPTENLSCVNCIDPIATPIQTTTYTIEFIDENGCSAQDEVKILFNGIIWVPNTFTPNNDGINDFFFVEGGNIDIFHIDIFNRWGELIYFSDQMTDTWDGTYDGLECQDGTYVWKIIWEDKTGERQLLTGHVNLLR